MDRTLVDRIAVQVPLEPRLASVVRVAVISAARESGMPGSQARPFAATVCVRFRDVAGRAKTRSRSAGTGQEPYVSLYLDKAHDGLVVRIDPGRGKRGAVLRARRGITVRRARRTARR